MRIFLILFFSSSIAFAAVDEDQFKLCAAKEADVERLECFDNLALASGLTTSPQSPLELSEDFLQSIVIVRPGILDLGETTVSDYVKQLESNILDDGSSPKILGWTRNSNRYILRVEFLAVTTDLIFVHDLSESSGGDTSLLQPIDFNGELVSAFDFSYLIFSQ